MPMLVLAGEQASGAFLIEPAGLVATNVNGVTIKGSGHWLMEEAPESTMTELVRFISTLLPSKGCRAKPHAPWNVFHGRYT